MTQNRKSEEFDDDRKKWKIYFDLKPDALMSEKVIDVRFRINKKELHHLREGDIEKLKRDLKDLGKFRIIKQGREFFKNE